jgi:hypothetical protein
MNDDQIIDALNEIGETGNAEIRHGNALYTRREENVMWYFVGTVRDIEEARSLICNYFNT